MKTTTDRPVAVGEDIKQRLERYTEFDEIHTPYLRWQLSNFRPYLGQRVLEVGCGVGGILAELGERELLVGLDNQSDVLEAARDRMSKQPYCRLIAGDIAALSDVEHNELQSMSLDTIVCINTLEHIRDDVAVLQRFEKLVAPGGHICLLVPAHNFLYGAYDQLDGHYRRYCKSYLSVILRQTGFQTIKLHYFNFLGCIGWFWHYKMLRRTNHGRSQFRVTNVLTRLQQPFENILKPPCGLSVVAVLKRPTEN